MKLIVGLGNPGRKYEGTRHNVGYEVLAELARRNHAGRPKVKFQGEMVELLMDGEKLLLLSPTTYMNLSGNSVHAAREYFRLPNENILVICDDLNLAIGRLRCRGKGSCGGQKGLRNIVQRLGSETLARLRVGIGEVPDRWDAADYVLGKFTKQERPLMDESVMRAADAAEHWVHNGVLETMNRFNAPQ